MSKDSWWTVSAVHDDTQEGYVAFVKAPSAGDARSKALREAPGVINIASIIEGKHKPADDLSDAPTPIHGRGHTVDVAIVTIRVREQHVPMRCPSCKADFRRARALVQVDLIGRSWQGHLPVSKKINIAAEIDQAPTASAVDAVSAVRIRCSKCGHAVWDGLHAGKEVGHG